MVPPKSFPADCAIESTYFYRVEVGVARPDLMAWYQCPITRNGVSRLIAFQNCSFGTRRENKSEATPDSDHNEKSGLAIAKVSEQEILARGLR